MNQKSQLANMNTHKSTNQLDEVTIRTIILKRWKERSIGLSKQKKVRKFSYFDCLYGLLALIINLMASFVITMVPVHNSITNPKYWYEMMFSSASWILFEVTANTIAMVSIIDPFNKRSIFVILNLLTPVIITGMLSDYIIHIFWSMVLGYFDPIPYRWWLVAYLSISVFYLRIWNEIPKERRLDHKFRKRCIWYICTISWIVFISVQLKCVLVVFRKIPNAFQWVFSLIVPLTKEINDYITDKLLNKSALSYNLGTAKFIGKIATNLTYSYWLAIILALEATKVTGYVLLGINFLVNMTLCYKIINLENKNRNLDNKMRQCLKQDATTELILNETVELIVPIAFIASFSSAYYGPNQDSLGNVGCRIWQFSKVENIQEVLIPVVEMALLDSTSVLVASALLWNFCNMNILKEYNTVIKKYWIHIGSLGGLFLNTVSITYIK